MPGPTLQTSPSHAEHGPAELADGTIVAERYRLGALVGEGAIATVYVADHLTVGRQVAVKVLSQGWAANARMAARFRAEARAASAAGHPGIVEVFDAGHLDDGRPFIVMEYLSGRELWEVIGNEAPLSVARACRIGRDIARAVAAAHAVGIVHRDLKAENVMVVGGGEDERIKVLDFGIASGIAEWSGRATTPGTVMGTPAYMSPEQAAGAEATPSFDVYAIGTLLFEMLTGQLPFQADPPLKVLALKCTGPAPSVRALREDLPPDLVELVDGCLAIAPDDRPHSAAAIAQRLATMLASAPSRTHATVVDEPAPRSRRPAAAWLAAAVTIVGLVAASVAARDDARPAAAAIAAPDPSEGASPQLATPPPTTHDDAQATAAGRPDPIPAPAPSAALPTETPAPPPTARSVATRRAAEASATPTTKPVAMPVPEPADEIDEAACARDRARARLARNAQLWPEVLQQTADRTCWPSSRERVALRVLALRESKRWDSCVRTGERSDDPEIAAMVAFCRKRSQADSKRAP